MNKRMSAEAKEIHEQKWNLMLELKYTVYGRPPRREGGGRGVSPLDFHTWYRISVVQI